MVRARAALLPEQEQIIFVFCRHRLNLATFGGHIGLTGKRQCRRPCYRKGYQMSATVSTAAVVTPATAAPAKKVAAPAAPAKAKAAPAKATAPQAPRFVMGPWPVKAQGGNSIRGYCYSVAKGLAKAHPQGFTANEFAAALASNASGSTYKQPSAGWGTAAKPNGNALAHANWFAHAKQGWLAPAPAKAPAKA